MDTPQEGSSATDDVIFRPKSTWQKDDCINQHADYNCPNESTLEAVYKNALIRCCGAPKCMARAAEIARASPF